MIIMMIHKMALTLAILLGLVHLAKKSDMLKLGHRICGLTAIGSFILYLIVNPSTNSGYFVYAFLLCLTGMIPYLLHKKRGRSASHIGAAVLAIAWLVIIHVM